MNLGSKLVIQSRSFLLSLLFVTLNSDSTVPSLSLMAWFKTMEPFWSDTDLWKVPLGMLKIYPHDSNLTL